MKRLWPLLLVAACGGGPTTPADSGVPDAGGTVGDGGMDELVAAHNAVRARAMPVPNPALPPMSWSPAAAAFAAAWVEGCNFDHNPGLGNTYGENIYATTASSVSPTAVVEDWADEEPEYDYATNHCASICGHYTQVVWRASTGVGCAWKSCTANSPFGNGRPWLFWVCDYAPAGNIVGQRPY